MEASDEELMRQVAQGHAAAFRQLAARHAARGMGLARRVTGNAADAEEIVQDALLRVWLHAPRWRPVAAFKTWFYRIVLNLALNRRRGPQFVAIEQAGDLVDGSDHAALLETAEIDRQVLAAVGSLPERQRAAIALTYQDGFSNADSAAILGVSVSAFESLLVRAKRSLRQQLDAVMGE
ncbi:MAG: sigma-70 family RNA polymerase sigma factor [Pseudorhodoplanes sp.]